MKASMPPSSSETYLLGVTEIAVGFIFHNAGLALYSDGEESVQWVGLCLARLMNLFDHGRSELVPGAALTKELYLFGSVSPVRVNILKAQRPFDGNLPITEGRVREYLRLFSLFEGEEGIADTGYVLLRKLAVLLAKVLPEGFEPLGRVDELHLSLTVHGLPVGEHPNVGGDTRVVKHIEGERHDCFEPVVFDDPAADVAFPLAGVAGKERGAVVDFGDTASEVRDMLHLAQHVCEEQHLAVARPG